MDIAVISVEKPKADWTKAKAPGLRSKAPRTQGAGKHWVDPAEEVMNGNPNFSPPLIFARE